MDDFWGSVKGVAVLRPQVAVFQNVPVGFCRLVGTGQFTAEEKIDFFFGKDRRTEWLERRRGRCCRTCDHDGTLAFVGKFPFSSPAGGLPGVKVPAAILPASVVADEIFRPLRPAPG